MVNIGNKPISRRRARAEGIIQLSSATMQAIRDGKVEKGEPTEVARIAAIQAAKSTFATIPHCHPVPIHAVEVAFEEVDEGIRCACYVEADYRTGVEMEALHGVSVALLTIWDMVKYLEKDERGQYPSTRITNIAVVEKVK
jgi:cyclic pyranopterin phosphate synthase